VAVEVGVEDERGYVDHGHHGVEVHEGMTVRKLDGNDRGRLVVREQGPGHRLDGHRTRPLAHADQDGTVSDDMDVTALDVRRLVVVVVAAVIGDELGPGEQWVVLVDGPGVE